MSRTMTVRLSGALNDFVAANVGENGSYENISEYVRDLIRRDKERAGQGAFDRLKAELTRARAQLHHTDRGRGYCPEQDLTGWPSASKRWRHTASTTLPLHARTLGHATDRPLPHRMFEAFERIEGSWRCLAPHPG